MQLKRIVMVGTGFGLLVVLVWWWQWQAPYRTLKTFLVALERSDVNTIYNLAPPKERKLEIITPDLIQYTVQHLLRPLLLDRYQLVGIRRSSTRSGRPEIWIRDTAVLFVLHHRDREGNEISPPLVVFVSRPLGEKKWYVPFSYFVYTTAHSLIGFDETQGDAWMYRVGYRFVYLHNGGVMPLKPPR